MIPTELLNKLRDLRSYDALLDFLDGLGFTYADEPRSTVAWPASIRDDVLDLKVAAKHGGFSVFYAQVPAQRMLTWERQIVGQLLRQDPHSIFVFTDQSHQVWHFVHVRYDEQLDRRRQLRRFVVDLSDPRGSQRLRTTAERLGHLAIPPGQTLSVLEMQARCDEAFRISEVSKGFLASFRKVVTDLTEALRQSNPTLLTRDEDALEQAQLLMDRLVFLYFVQKKGWLNGEQDYIFSRFRRRYQESPQADTAYREHLLPLFRALSHRDAERPRLASGEEEALPFLNGGLFDLPLAHGTANPPMDERIRVPNEALYEIFETFLERYKLVPEIKLMAPVDSFDPLRASTAVWIERWLNEAGIPVSVDLRDSSEIVSKVFAQRDFQMALLVANLATYPSYLVTLFHSQGGSNAGSYANPSYDAAAQQFFFDTDLSNAQKNARQLQTFIAQDLPVLPLFNVPVLEVYREDSVQWAFTTTLNGLQRYFQDINGALSYTRRDE